jgi:pilus assembly protein Flp/PilA
MVALADMFSDLVKPLGAHNMKTLVNFFQDENGATAIEYGLIAALISVAAIAAMSSLGTKLSTLYGNISTNLR